mgnify:CR=1 FL=1
MDLQTLIFDLIEIKVTTNELELLMAHPERYVNNDWDAVKLEALLELVDLALRQERRQVGG